MQTYESTVSITQGSNLARLRKRKDKYTIQVFKVDLPTSQSILVSPPDVDSPPLNMKKLQPPSKIFLGTKKSLPPHIAEEGGHLED